MDKNSKAPKSSTMANYSHKEKEALLRPDAGLQAQFKKKKPPKVYRYDSSIAPELSWDTNADREKGEALIAKILSAKNIDEARYAAEQLKALSAPFLNWAGKAENKDLTVPTLPLFIHERLSTRAILESVKKRQSQMNLFADPELSIAERLSAYEHKTGWVNRLILGDNLQVMNSLLEFEGLGGQVQMIYMDPPYGVKFGSNFQPFIRKRDIDHNKDEDFTREPEMVQAYRDTWELGLHSYLTYLRDRFKIAKDLLSPSGSIFVQISDENVHHVRELMDEVFGENNFATQISYRTTGGRGSKLLDQVLNYLLWYSNDLAQTTKKYHQIYEVLSDEILANYDWIKTKEGEFSPLNGGTSIKDGTRYQLTDLTSQGQTEKGTFLFHFDGEDYLPRPGRHWSTTQEGMSLLAKNDRLQKKGKNIFYRRFASDFPVRSLDTGWEDTAMGGYLRNEEKIYVVQTPQKVIERCMLMTTDPGELVLDITCGSGTSAYCAEKWGRRWITSDISRVPLALTRQRLLTATYPWYELRDPSTGLSGGFKYERKQNTKGEDIGGLVPHITLESIAKNEPPSEAVLVDKPNINSGIVRVSGTFWIEATIPTPVDIDADRQEDSGTEIGDYYERVFLALRQSPILRLSGNQTLEFEKVKEIANSLSLQAEALTNKNGDKPVAFVFGPPSSAVSEKQVFEAAREAHLKGYSHLYVLGFACQDRATKFIKEAAQIVGIPTSFVNVTMDIQMGDLLKNQRSSQIFSITGSPEIRLVRLNTKNDKGETLYRVELLGLDTFDPVKADIDHVEGDDVPCWLLDTDYNELSFKVCQAFFPRTSAWDNLKKSLKAQFEDSVWEHFRGNISESFSAGENEKIAIKVIDDRGNELMLVKPVSEAKAEGAAK